MTDLFTIHLEANLDTKKQLQKHLNKTELSQVLKIFNEAENELDIAQKQVLSSWFPLSSPTRLFNYLLTITETLNKVAEYNYINNLMDVFSANVNRHHKKLQENKFY